eukprot:5234250-Amphidinium_carterae.1
MKAVGILVWRSSSCALCSVPKTKVDGMFHEGTIPEPASRMTMSNIFMSFGHGLRGLLPSIPGTMSLLSLWENGFEGQLPATVGSSFLVE